MIDLKTLKSYKIAKKILAKEFNSKEYEIQLCADELIELATILNTTTIIGSDVPGIEAGTYSLDVTVDGGSLNQLIFSIFTTDDWNTIASSIQTSLRAETLSTETVEVIENTLTITSATTGESSTILIEDGTNESGIPLLNYILTNINTLVPNLNTPVTGGVGTSGYAEISNIQSNVTPLYMVLFATPTARNLHSAFNWESTHAERLVIAEYILDKIPVLFGSDNKMYTISKME